VFRDNKSIIIFIDRDRTTYSFKDLEPRQVRTVPTEGFPSSIDRSATVHRQVITAAAETRKNRTETRAACRARLLGLGGGRTLDARAVHKKRLRLSEAKTVRFERRSCLGLQIGR